MQNSSSLFMSARHLLLVLVQGVSEFTKWCEVCRWQIPFGTSRFPKVPFSYFRGRKELSVDMKDAVELLAEDVFTEYCLLFKDEQLSPLVVFPWTIRKMKRNGEA